MKIFLAIGALLCVGSSAQAGLTLSLDGAPTFGGGVYTYNYSIGQATNDTIRTNDFFQLFDFNGLVDTPAPTAPGGWDVDYSLGGPSPAPWVKFTYTGVPNLTANNISGFAISSTVGPDTTPSITWVGKNYGENGLPVNNAVNPTFGPQQDSAVPEPATMGLMGGALISLGMLARRRK